MPWPVTAPVGWFLERTCKETGLAPMVERAVWVPSRSLDLIGLRLHPSLAGTLRASKVRLTPRWRWLALGQVRARFRLEEIRWELGPGESVEAEGGGVLRLGWGRVALEELALEGSAVRLKGEGWLKPGRRARLLLEGDLSPELVRKAGWIETQDPSGRWEPFRLRVEGPLGSPRVEFASRFLTFSMNVPAEPAP